MAVLKLKTSSGYIFLDIIQKFSVNQLNWVVDVHVNKNLSKYQIDTPQENLSVLWLKSGNSYTNYGGDGSRYYYSNTGGEDGGNRGVVRHFFAYLAYHENGEKVEKCLKFWGFLTIFGHFGHFAYHKIRVFVQRTTRLGGKSSYYQSGNSSFTRNDGGSYYRNENTTDGQWTKK